MNSKLITILIPTLVFLTGCDKSDPKPLTELEKLPPATQEGKYTFGCLVNGKAFFTKSTLDVVAIYQQGTLTLGGSIQNNRVSQSISMVLNEQSEILTTGEYTLNEPPFLNAGYSKYDEDGVGCYYLYEDTFTGTLIITKFDKVNYIISGLFEFSTVTTNCDTLRITDGRFDIKYIP